MLEKIGFRGVTGFLERVTSLNKIDGSQTLNIFLFEKDYFNVSLKEPEDLLENPECFNPKTDVIILV